MELLFLGTGAADWPQAPSDGVPKGNLPMSSLLIDGIFWVDPGPQSFDHTKALGADLPAISDVCITHTHGDHFQKKVLLRFAEAARKKPKSLVSWGNSGAAGFDGSGGSKSGNPRFDPSAMGPGRRFSSAPLAANHLVEMRMQGTDGLLFLTNYFQTCTTDTLLAYNFDFMVTCNFVFLVYNLCLGLGPGRFRGRPCCFPQMSGSESRDPVKYACAHRSRH